ncbi:hypothetical protein [Flagellimonas iocasae]|uniref:Uncharacterized protein n=1 Tax=Flagellimonas iocasae TaxID=2055905 RepID=A0ABW4XZG3_9FLAO
MVHLIAEIKRIRENILQQKNIQSAFYLYINNERIDFELAGVESMSLLGYKGEQVSNDDINAIISAQSKKNQIDNNVFKLLGLYLACKGSDRLKMILDKKFHSSQIELKYLIYKVLPEQYRDKLILSLSSGQNNLIRYLLDEEPNIEELDEEIDTLLKSTIGINELVLMEDFLKMNNRVGYQNLTALEMVNQVIKNFPEAIKKIKHRRKGKNNFEFKDEYDVQDILYVMLKPLFPMLKEEDPIPKVGASSTRIDLILREKGVLIEVKMIKENDTDEAKFIKQLKEDIQSYHICQWMKTLICFVYDPFDKTKDRNNFYDLNGQQTINGKNFDVEVIVLK